MKDDRAKALFGTAEPVETPHRLLAEPLSADLQDGNLRDGRFQGREISIAFLVRDARWETYRPAFSPTGRWASRPNEQTRVTCA